MAGSVRVMSANLWRGRADPEALVEMIHRFEIDVLAAQELGFDQAEAISTILPFGGLDPHDEFMGMGIASRRPARYSRIPLHFRDGHRIELDPKEWEGLEGPCEIVNVHLQAPHAIRPFPSVLVRHRQVSDLLRFFASAPVASRAVVGDYNSTPIWPTYRRIAREFSDAAMIVAQKQGRDVERTWGPTADSARLLRIDHAMVRGVDVPAFQVVDIPGSDHSALVFECAPEAAPDA